MEAMSETLAVLKSIDESLRKLVIIAQQKAEARVKSAAQKPTQKVASDADLDGKYGNGPVKFDPRDWSGPPCKGLPYSECPVEFLELLAETNDYFAQKADENDEKTSSGKPVAPYKRQEAARCRGWAERIRSGKHKQAAEPEAEPEGWA